MKYYVQMASGGSRHIPVFIKINSGVQNLLGGIHLQRMIDTQRQEADLHELGLFSSK
jgi:hypothetical protein